MQPLALRKRHDRCRARPQINAVGTAPDPSAAFESSRTAQLLQVDIVDIVAQLFDVAFRPDATVDLEAASFEPAVPRGAPQMGGASRRGAGGAGRLAA